MHSNGHVPKLIIEGNGPLTGEVVASGAKNAVLPILAATILASEPVTLHNVPKLQDVIVLTDLLKDLGAKVEINGNTVVIDPRSITKIRASHNLVKLMRASILVLGPLVSKFGEAEVSLPGGCAIGSRPVDQHLKGLEALGANIELKNGYVFASTPNQTKLKGNHFTFDMITVTGAENIIMAAVLADGRTVLDNCAQEPEVVDLCEMLITLGAQIEGVGTSRLVIDGVMQLTGGEHTIMPDRIEVGTYLVAGAMTFGDIIVNDCTPIHQEATIEALLQTGCGVEVMERAIRVFPKASKLKAIDIKTQPYPKFATDMQAQFMALATIAEGKSTIIETIFENRFMHANELSRMGANIRIEDHMAIVTGVDRLSGAEVSATDLRASAALILAGLVADGTTTMDQIYHLDRGYDGIERKLTGLGAKIRRI
ncbi:UDP-N-acetylglucosamine 1-carboxyvinyltransferase [Wohlfahrtiimonas chitiniclastica]|uniref:UDP-N-acetylglucosamine 1-carboxyvinyltransferase n=1 Tax=Wohlfahrtiimonas chitiniclastica TaxID=400946 RepID=UPI001BCFD806|nr:UDP-N-acetylglucosamine 1-carboxyvinyltransferase [Wohlfahrtiimonas chitiniclastica]MBS7839147.1 UDP-N-acetylglucosamine 1-carboxyvinyltransferase [Wohlfahrtiimonas chitiniclastica]